MRYEYTPRLNKATFLIKFHSQGLLLWRIDTYSVRDLIVQSVQELMLFEPHSIATKY